jgi:hypothetical protein
MASLDLLSNGQSFPVSKRSLFAFFEQHPELYGATTYRVQSAVPPDIFEAFVTSLTTLAKIAVTTGNSASLGLLAKEFCLPELATECAISSISARVYQLELRCFSVSKRPRSIEEQVRSQERGLERLRLQITEFASQADRKTASLRSEIERQLTRLDRKVAVVDGRVDKQQRECESLRGEVTAIIDRLKSSPAKLNFPMREARSLDGIIAFVTNKHGGNVHETGIVTITAKSADDPEAGPKIIADLTSDLDFCAKNEPGQWICWDFGDRRVRPTNYTINGWGLKSWVVEGSANGANWVEMDRKTGNQEFNDDRWMTASFAVSKPVEVRCIRLTQTEKNRYGNHYLVLRAVEFFGTLSE